MKYCAFTQYEIRAISCLFKPANRLDLPTPNHIIAIVSAGTRISADEITGKVRTRNLSEARTIAMSLIRSYFPAMSLSKIGVLFGGRDHSTVLYNLNLSNDLCLADKDFRKKYTDIKYQVDKVLGREII